MSYSLALRDGDLTTTGSVLTTVSGVDKLKQEVDLWLREIYQVDRFHRDYGSVLNNFIGQTISKKTIHDIEIEVNRVMSNLQNLQVRRLKTNPAKYGPDELLRTVTSVKSRVSYDAIFVEVVFESAAGTVATTSVGVSV